MCVNNADPVSAFEPADDSKPLPEEDDAGAPLTPARKSYDSM